MKIKSKIINRSTLDKMNEINRLESNSMLFGLFVVVRVYVDIDDILVASFTACTFFTYTSMQDGEVRMCVLVGRACMINCIRVTYKV